MWGESRGSDLVSLPHILGIQEGPDTYRTFFEVSSGGYQEAPLQRVEKAIDAPAGRRFGLGG